jgi:hypothetical protein
VIRTAYQLSEALTKSLAWRKHELSNLRLLHATLNRDHQRAALRRASLPIVYAHWEGFVKTAATHYLEFVSRQGLKCREVQTNMLALACRGTIREAAVSDRPHIHTQLIDFLVLNEEDPLRLPFKDVINTRSNLNSEVLQDILWVIGIAYGPTYRTKELLIDGSLLSIRNDIAHGRGREVDEVTYHQLHDLVLELIDAFHTDVENAAYTGGYRRAA